VDLYGHLTAEAALDAVDSLGTVLDAAAELAAERATRAATALRLQDYDPHLLSGFDGCEPLVMGGAA
jgi:hypothetical protein